MKKTIQNRNIEEDLFYLEQELDIPYKLRYYNNREKKNASTSRKKQRED